jgi:arylsulfatase A-like enzyme/Tfp pilus assembly protein PilF
MRKLELGEKHLGKLGALILILVLAGSGCERVRTLLSGKRPNVLIITMDTTRADHLGCYGYQNIKTPALDRLAQEGVRFEKVYATAPITLPSHASIMTGTYPIYHGARNNATYRVDDSITTAAEIFKRKGYQTAAFIAAFPLLGRFGLRQGFDVYDDRIEEGKEKRAHLFQERRADDQSKLAVQWLEHRPPGPFFMWVHYFDPHFAYEPPSPFREEYFFHPYDGEIAFVDSQIGRLLEALRQEGILDDTLVVVTADHGESLGEHEEKTHAMLIYYGTIQVPLILRFPKQFPAKTVVSDMVRSIDILPTLLDYVGIPAIPQIQGVSLRPLIAGKKKSLDLVAYTETMAPYLHFNWSLLEGLRTTEYSYIKADPEELYQVNQDPKELHDLSGTDPKKLAQLRTTLDQLKPTLVNPKPPDAAIKMDTETEDRLRALGYIQGSAKPPQPGAKLPNPRFKVAMLEQFFAADSLLAAEQYERSLTAFDQIIAQDPSFGRAYLEKGMAYFKLHEYEKAIENYNRAEELLPDQTELYLNRAQSRLALDQTDTAKAVADLYQGLKLDPTNSQAYVTLAHIKFMEKKPKEGFDLLLKAVKANPKSEKAHFELGSFYRLLGKFVEAKNEFLQSKNANPDFAPAAFELARLQYQTGEGEAAMQNLQEALNRDPKMVQAHALLAQIFLDKDQPDKAQAHLDIALALNPNSATAHFTQGNILVKKSNLKGAMVEFEKTVELSPNHALAHKNLGALYAISGDAPKALEHYRLSLQLMPKQPNVDKIKAAIEDLEKNGAPIVPKGPLNPKR